MWASDAGLAVGYEAELEAADSKADIERLIEVGFEFEDLRVPRLRARELGCRVDGGAQTEDHRCLLENALQFIFGESGASLCPGSAVLAVSLCDEVSE